MIDFGLALLLTVAGDPQEWLTSNEPLHPAIDRPNDLLCDCDRAEVCDVVRVGQRSRRHQDSIVRWVAAAGRRTRTRVVLGR